MTDAPDLPAAGRRSGGVVRTALLGGFAGLFAMALYVAYLSYLTVHRTFDYSTQFQGHDEMPTVATSVMIALRGIPAIMFVGSIVAFPASFLLTGLMRVGQRSSALFTGLPFWLIGSIVVTSPLVLFFSRELRDRNVAAAIWGCALIGGLVSWHADRRNA